MRSIRPSGIPEGLAPPDKRSSCDRPRVSAAEAFGIPVRREATGPIVAAGSDFRRRGPTSGDPRTGAPRRRAASESRQERHVRNEPAHTFARPAFGGDRAPLHRPTKFHCHRDPSRPSTVYVRCSGCGTDHGPHPRCRPMTLGAHPASSDAARRSQLRILLGQSVRFGAMSLAEAAMTEAAIAASCGGPGFALGLAEMENARQAAIVRSAAGRRGSVLHAFLILDATSGHRADWIVGDVYGTQAFGDAARRWGRDGCSLAVEPAPDRLPDRPGRALTAAVARRLPWLSGLAIAVGARPATCAVGDLARIGRIIQRCPEGSIEVRLQELDRVSNRVAPLTEDADSRDPGLAAFTTTPERRAVDASTRRCGPTPADERPLGARP